MELNLWRTIRAGSVVPHIKSVDIEIMHLSLLFLCVLCALCGLIIPIQPELISQLQNKGLKSLGQNYLT